MLRPLTIALLALCSALAAAQPAPQRIASMNVCTDQLLLLLVAPARIVSLSALAQNPSYSNLATLATAFPTNRGQADELLAAQPDLVLTSLFSGTFTAQVLQRLQQRVERLGFATTLDEVWQQVDQVAVWTGTDATPLTAAAKHRIAAAQTVLRERLQGKRAVFISSNGIAFGSGTLQDDFLRSLGVRNVAAEAGVAGPAPLALEHLIAAEADYLLVEPRGALDEQLAHPLLSHAALRHRPLQTLQLRDRWFDCAGPWLADAYESLLQQVPAP